MPVHAGRVSPNTSPCARRISAVQDGVGHEQTACGRRARARAGLAQRRLDDLEAALRLAVRIGRRVGVVRHDRRRPGDEDARRRRRPRGSSRPRALPRRSPTRSMRRSTAPSIAAVDALRAIDALGRAHGRRRRRRGRAASSAPTARADARLRWASVTKLLTGLAALVARRGGDRRPRRARRPGGLDAPPPARARLRARAGGGPAAHAAGAAADLLELRDRARRGAASPSAPAMPFDEYSRAAVARAARPRRLPRTARPPGATAARSTTCSRSARELLAPTLVAAETLAEATSVQFPGLAGVLPSWGRMEPNDWGLAFELRDEKSPHWTGTLVTRRARSATSAPPARSSGSTRTRASRARVLTDREFGDWAKEAWPRVQRLSRRANIGRISSSNVARSQLATTAGVIAVTVAVRGMSIASATSPK